MSNNTPKPEKPKCGIIMPISAIDGLSEAHWLEVNNILSDAIETAGFEANLVSSAEDVGIIQKTIIQNLYDNPVVVCDVSGKNPNVMFELGMRLAFDKPTIIVKDDKTTYSFDTSPIEHLNYPRDLRFSQIVDFKTLLSDKIKNTYSKASTDHNYTTFLKHFGEFKVAKIDKTEVSGQEFIIEELRNVRQAIARLERPTRPENPFPRYRFTIALEEWAKNEALRDYVENSPFVELRIRNDLIMVDVAQSREAGEDIRRLISLGNTEDPISRSTES